MKDEQTVWGGAPGLLAREGGRDGAALGAGDPPGSSASGSDRERGQQRQEGAPGRDGGEGPGWPDWGPRAIQASAVEDKAATPFLEMGMLGADKPGAWGTTP